MSAQPVPTAEQRAALARDFARRNAYPLRSPRSQAHPSAAVSEWRAAPRPQATRKSAPASRLERFNAAVWRLHAGTPALWALLAAVVFVGSGAFTVAMIATGLGWRP